MTDIDLELAKPERHTVRAMEVLPFDAIEDGLRVRQITYNGPKVIPLAGAIHGVGHLPGVGHLLANTGQVWYEAEWSSPVEFTHDPYDEINVMRNVPVPMKDCPDCFPSEPGPSPVWPTGSSARSFLHGG